MIQILKIQIQFKLIISENFKKSKNNDQNLIQIPKIQTNVIEFKLIISKDKKIDYRNSIQILNIETKLEISKKIEIELNLIE